MISLTASRSEHLDPEEARRAVAAAMKSGAIKAAPRSAGPTEKFDPEAIRKIVAEAKASGALTSPISVLDPATIARIGKDVLTSTGVISQWIDVDPGLAAHWLQNNFVNRPLSSDVVDAYARDMVNGQWVQTHQGVAFNDLDHLIDGQHRLQAIIKSGVTVRMMVTFGLASKIKGKEMTTMDAVDRGRPRSVADQLKIQHGMKNGGAIASICASLGHLCYHKKTRRLSVGDTLAIYRLFEESVDWVIGSKPVEAGLKTNGVLAAFAFAMNATADKEDVGRIRGLFVSLKYGDGLSEGMPVWHLRKFLLSDDAKLLNRGSDRGLAELVLLALQLQIAGETIERLELSQNGLHMFRALQPERVAKVVEIFQAS